MKIQLFEIGEFANRIGGLLSKRLETDRIKVEDNDFEKLPVRYDADLYVVISEHLCVDLCKYIDNINHNYKKCFLPIVVDHPYLTVGPFVQYGQGACYHCYYERFMQHNPIPHVTRALERHYSEFIGKGPKGYHPLDVAIVSNWLFYSVKNSFNHFQGKDPWAMVCPPPGDENPASVRHFHGKDPWATFCPPPRDENPPFLPIMKNRRKQFNRTLCLMVAWTLYGKVFESTGCTTHCPPFPVIEER